MHNINVIYDFVYTDSKDPNVGIDWNLASYL